MPAIRHWPAWPLILEKRTPEVRRDFRRGPQITLWPHHIQKQADPKPGPSGCQFSQGRKDRLASEDRVATKQDVVVRPRDQLTNNDRGVPSAGPIPLGAGPHQLYPSIGHRICRAALSCEN